MHAWLLFSIGCMACGGAPQRITKASSTIYVRSDTDRTTIVTPSIAVAANVARATAVELDFEIDAWTGASVDVVTAATATIHETRSAGTVAATHQLGDARLRASYRYSTEPDYRSHGAVLGATLELGAKNTTLAAFALASRDTVGRAGDPLFEQPLWSAGARLSLSQVLDRRTIADVALEATRLDGYQASPYRFVAVGGDGTCGAAPFCVPEQVPDQRMRLAALARIRRALDRAWSAGAEYRFYIDDWGVRSHAIQPDLAWRVGAGVLALRYRYYTQADASFYRARYLDLMDSGYRTRDRKLSAFYSNELGVSYLHRFALGDGGQALTAGLRTTGSRLDYLAFVGLDRVYALDLTALIGLELP